MWHHLGTPVNGAGWFLSLRSEHPPLLRGSPGQRAKWKQLFHYSPKPRSSPKSCSMWGRWGARGPRSGPRFSARASLMSPGKAPPTSDGGVGAQLGSACLQSAPTARSRSARGGGHLGGESANLPFQPLKALGYFGVVDAQEALVLAHLGEELGDRRRRRRPCARALPPSGPSRRC